MKSSRENEFWKSISQRLENYQEEPVDDWDKISGALPPETKGLSDLSRSSDVIVAVILAFLMGFQVAQWQMNDGKIVPQNMSAGLTGEISREKLSSPEKIPAASVSDAVSQSHNTQNESDDVQAGGDDDNNRLDRADTRYAINKSSGKNTIFKLTETSGEEQKTQSDETLVAHVIEKREQSFVSETVQRDSNAGVTSEIKKDSVEKQVIMKKDTTSVTSPVKAAEKKRRKKFRPSVYFQLTPSMAYQKIIPSKTDAINIQKLNSPGVISADRFGWSAEAGFQMQVSPKLELYTALSHYQQQQVISYTYATDETRIMQNPDGLSYTVSPGSATREFAYNMRNTGISAGALYFLKGKKLMHKIGGGVFYQKGFRGRKENDSYTNAQSDYFGYQLLYRLEYVLNRRTNFFVQPVFTHSLFSSEKLDEPFTIKPYRAGIGFGLVYHF
jgi:hypothetical protein